MARPRVPAVRSLRATLLPILALLLGAPVARAQAPAAAPAPSPGPAAPAAAPAPSPAPAAPSVVIPPGREDVLGRMMGLGEALPGGCRLSGLRIDKATAHADYACEGGLSAALELVPRDADPSPAAATAQFALVDRTHGAPAALVRAVEERVRREEAGWTWARPAGTPAPPPVPPPPQPVAPAQPEFTPDLQARYDEAESLLKAGRGDEAFDRLKALAREHPSPAVLGLLVAAAARITDTPERWQQAAAAADAAPDDPLANFIAGVSAHYYAHNWGTSRAEKTPLYVQAIHYLKRSLPAFEKSPRVWIYQGVSYFRTGHQAEAEAAIDKAIALAGQTRDADAWYCRAEVRHVKDPEGALKDLDVYRQIMGENAAHGAIHSASKDRKVAEMQARLERMAKGEEPPDPDDMFDPPAGPFYRALHFHAWAFEAAAALAVVGLLAAVAVAVGRRRKGGGRG